MLPIIGFLLNGAELNLKWVFGMKKRLHGTAICQPSSRSWNSTDGHLASLTNPLWWEDLERLKRREHHLLIDLFKNVRMLE